MKRTCFIVCPIGEEGSEIRKNSDQLLKHILQPVCNECNFECVRVDNLHDNDSITDTIIKYLKESDLVIADLSTHNPNAFFELGYRTALNKPAIHLKNSIDTLPFDVSAIRTIVYDLKDLDKVEETKNRLKETIKNLTFDEQSQSDSSNNNFNSLLLTEIYKIQDEVRKLNTSISSKDNSAISILADKLSNSSQSLEVAIVQSLFSLLENPIAVQNLLTFSANTINQNSDSKSEKSSDSKS